jgi:outer membrane protein
VKGMQRAAMQHVKRWAVVWPVICAVAAHAAAEEPPSFETLFAPPKYRWFIRLDVAGVLPALQGKTTVAGVLIPGNTVGVNNSVTVSVDIGHFFTEEVAVAAIIGFPPLATLKGANALASVGAGATARYGPAALLLQYHPGLIWQVRPYLGVGVSYTPFIDVKDVAVNDVRLKNAWGPAFQIGIDYPLNERWAVNLDALKILVSTTASGNLQGVPVTSMLTINPLILRGGVTWRF